MRRDGCSLQGIVRHPYEPWSVRYTQHERGYTGGQVIVLKALLDRLTEAKALDRLGEPEWLGAAAAKLSSYTSWYAPKGTRLVTETCRVSASEQKPRARSTSSCRTVRCGSPTRVSTFGLTPGRLVEATLAP
ncbi:hypothetical protein OG373_40940 [Streptomyces avidinii]|uniref:hypothetical protein n=1 Tax=Streptomyces avidinii TaxID=1895 RepID=UPI003864EEFB|nr:hypothetical protein OG373_00230 [Streptomyces avidinii]WTB02225.1 hypothetical protein OG373_40940 [Streptomyces avidinii]